MHRSTWTHLIECTVYTLSTICPMYWCTAICGRTMYFSLNQLPTMVWCSDSQAKIWRMSTNWANLLRFWFELYQTTMSTASWPTRLQLLLTGRWLSILRLFHYVLFSRNFPTENIMSHFWPMLCEPVTLSRLIAGETQYTNAQNVHAGSPVEDLGRLMSSSVSTDVRRHHTDDILHAYYDSLCEYARVQSVIPFSFDDVKRYQICRGIVPDCGSQSQVV